MGQARTEFEAIYIYRRLTDDGYLIEQDGECWKATEPNSRMMPQSRRGFRSMREVSAWADGVEAVRFVTIMNADAD